MREEGFGLRALGLSCEEIEDCPFELLPFVDELSHVKLRLKRGRE